MLEVSWEWGRKVGGRGRRHAPTLPCSDTDNPHRSKKTCWSRCWREWRRRPRPRLAPAVGASEKRRWLILILVVLFCFCAFVLERERSIVLARELCGGVWCEARARTQERERQSRESDLFFASHSLERHTHTTLHFFSPPHQSVTSRRQVSCTISLLARGSLWVSTHNDPRAGVAACTHPLWGAWRALWLSPTRRPHRLGRRAHRHHGCIALSRPRCGLRVCVQRGYFDSPPPPPRIPTFPQNTRCSSAPLRSPYWPWPRRWLLR